MANLAVKDIPTTPGTGFGEIIYNGYNFGQIRHANFTDEIVYSDAETKIKAVKRTVRIHSFVYSESLTGMQGNSETMRLALETPNQVLTMKDIGFCADTTLGGLAATETIVSQGVKPLTVQINPSGGELCYEIIWTAEFLVAPFHTIPKLGQLLSFDFETRYSVVNGLVTRTISGSMEIYTGVEKSGSIVTEANIDSIFATVFFLLPPFMKRATCDRGISKKANRIEFTIVDVEFAGDAFPDGIIECDFEEDFENIAPGFINWRGSIAGSMTVAKGYHKSLAANKFFLILADRIDKLNKMAASSKNGVVIPERIRMGSEMFGRTSRFAVGFRMVACLHDILKGALWTPVPGTSFASWQSSMSAVGMNSPQGVSNLRWSVEDYNTTKTIVGAYTARTLTPTGTPAGIFDCDKITKERSYLLYKNRIEAIQSQSALLHRISSFFTGSNQAKSDGSGYSIGAPFTQAAKEIVLQYQGSPDNLVLLLGRGLRIKYHPEPPVLTKIGETEVQVLAQAVDTEVETSYFHCPLISGRWAVLYVAKGYISTMKALNNDTLCFAEGQK